MITLSCSGGEMQQKKITYSSLKDIPDAAWEKLSQKTIYFGHQSVGLNILDGFKDLMEVNPKLRLNIVETTDVNNFTNGIFAHSRVGQNLDPIVKIDEFVKVLDMGVGKRADAVALKFCYLDIAKNTDIIGVFDYYKKEVNKLKNLNPELEIIHFTMPLTVSKTSWKTWIKKVIGKKEFWEFDDNIKRNQYNEMLVKEYQGKAPILDIAKIESSMQDGSRQSFELNRVTYYSMVPEYTKDGGHLNEIGRKKVAEQFLLLLANL